MVVFFFGGGWSFNVLFLRRLNKRVLWNTKIVKLKCFIYSNHSYVMHTCVYAHMCNNKIHIKFGRSIKFQSKNEKSGTSWVFLFFYAYTLNAQRNHSLNDYTDGYVNGVRIVTFHIFFLTVPTGEIFLYQFQLRRDFYGFLDLFGLFRTVRIPFQ